MTKVDRRAKAGIEYAVQMRSDPHTYKWGLTPENQERRRQYLAPFPYYHTTILRAAPADAAPAGMGVEDRAWRCARAASGEGGCGWPRVTATPPLAALMVTLAGW